MTAVPNTSRNGGFAAASAGVILASAFLLFQVQPVISKVILPWFGGSPAVWTTCMLFFQVLLLGGYAYAHWLSQSPSAARQAAIHVGLLFFAILMLPIVPGEHWKPVDSVHPTSRILWLLAAHVGLPYFALSATGPLVQAWFGRVCVGRSPYWLYALSNFGSLAALLSYPFVFEPLITTRGQGLLWSVSFAVFGIACGALTIRAWRNAVEPAGDSLAGKALTGKRKTDDAPAGADRPATADGASVSKAVESAASATASAAVEGAISAGADGAPSAAAAAGSLAVALFARLGLRRTVGHHEPFMPGRGRRAVHVGGAAELVSAVVHPLFRGQLVVFAAAVCLASPRLDRLRMRVANA
jgi:hypothetical protein